MFFGYPHHSMAMNIISENDNPNGLPRPMKKHLRLLISKQITKWSSVIDRRFEQNDVFRFRVFEADLLENGRSGQVFARSFIAAFLEIKTFVMSEHYSHVSETLQGPLRHMRQFKNPPHRANLITVLKRIEQKKEEILSTEKDEMEKDLFTD